MKNLLLVFVLVIGMLLPSQAAQNAQLDRHLGHPLLAAWVNFLVGGAILGLLLLIFGVQLPSAAALRSPPWWAWLGGTLGATLIVSATVSAPVLGASLLVVVLVAGQLVSSVLFDHFGWLGYPVRPLTWVRVVGILLVVLGAALVQHAHDT